DSSSSPNRLPLRIVLARSHETPAASTSLALARDLRLAHRRATRSDAGSIARLILPCALATGAEKTPGRAP
ncbi:MAG TPA: hypothetical protein VGK70_07655, partial [Thermoanaerobaculia bacterium]